MLYTSVDLTEVRQGMECLPVKQTVTSSGTCTFPSKSKSILGKKKGQTVK